ncbi:hypothetical protein GGH16_005710 [Coemansia sp. RSA 560]|nr:hypothetical protein GGH16_005710 [Coemansia sp. RSA 560]
MRVVIKEASSEDFVNRLVRDLMWATQTMLDMQSQTLGEALSTPLAKNTSTSDLANSIARSGSITMSDDMKHSHWQGILDKIGELKDSKAQQPKMELLDNGSKKSVYEKSC